MENSIFESGSIRKVYFSLALPVVFNMVITIVYNITDTYFIALTGNTDLVAGVSLCAPIFTLLMAFGNIFGQGGSSSISRLMGENDKENLHRVSSFCFYTAIIFGLVAGVVMLLFRMPLLKVLGADAGTIDFAGDYFTWMALGAPVVTLSFIHSNLLRAEGMAKQSMMATVGGSIVNIILDPIFIFGFKLGAAGAAMATVLGYVFSVGFCLLIVFKKSQVLSVDIRKYRIPGAFIGQIFGIGTSAALSNITQSVCLILTNQCLLVYGSDKIAAMGIVQKVSMIVMLVIVASSFGGAPLVGYHYGAKNREKLQELVRFLFRYLCGLAIAMSAVMIVLAPYAIRIFLQDESLVSIAVLMLRAQLVSMVFMAIVLFSTILCQATGKTAPAMALALSRQGVVFLVVMAIAVPTLGYYGILLTQPIADLLSAIGAAVLLKKSFAKDPVLGKYSDGRFPYEEMPDYSQGD